MDFVLHTDERPSFLASKASHRYGDPARQIASMLDIYVTQGTITPYAGRTQLPKMGSTLSVLWDVCDKTGTRHIWSGRANNQEVSRLPAEKIDFLAPHFFLLPRAAALLAVPVLRGVLSDTTGYILLQSSERYIGSHQFLPPPVEVERK